MNADKGAQDVDIEVWYVYLRQVHVNLIWSTDARDQPSVDNRQVQSHSKGQVNATFVCPSIEQSRQLIRWQIGSVAQANPEAVIKSQSSRKGLGRAASTH